VLPPAGGGATAGPLVVTVVGPDRPGVSAALFATLADCAGQVLDVEQVVLRGRLTLGVLVAVPEQAPAREALGKLGESLGLDVHVEAGGAERDTAGPRHHVMVVGLPVTPQALAALAAAVTGAGANIERIGRLARYPAAAYELLVAGGDQQVLRAALSAVAAQAGVDVAVERAGLARRAKRLVVLDVDSTLVQGEVIEMLAARAGCEREVANLTAAAMRGELDFAASLRARVALLAGLPVAVLGEVRDALQLTPGARTLVRTLRRLGYEVAAISGGFHEVVDALAEDLGLSAVVANRLECADGQLTGRLAGPVLDRAGKAAALERLAAAAGVPLAQTVAVGDGANDLDMLGVAGLGIAFNAKPVVRAAADAALSVPYLDAVLFLLGISRDEVDAADANG